MRPLLNELNEFGQFLNALAERAEKSLHKVALEAGIKGRSSLYYAISKNGHRHRPTTLKIETLLALAKAVAASQDETTRLVILGLSQQMPEPLRDYMDNLEREVAKLRKELGKRPLKIRISVDP